MEATANASITKEKSNKFFRILNSELATHASPDQGKQAHDVRYEAPPETAHQPV